MRILLVLAALAVSTTAAAQTDPPGGNAETISIAQPPATSWVGMMMEQQSRSSELGREVDPPVITAITPGSPAEAAGLRAGDSILRIDDCDTRETCVNWRRLVPGQRYRLRVRTGTAERDVIVVPAPPRGERRGS